MLGRAFLDWCLFLKPLELTNKMNFGVSEEGWLSGTEGQNDVDAATFELVVWH